MSDRLRKKGRFGGTAIGDLGLWGSAALAVVAVHAGVAIWFMHEPPVMASEGPPPAIMIEMAPMPEATDTDETELSEDQQDAQASAASEAVEAPEPVEDEVPEELPDEVEQEAEVALPSPTRSPPERVEVKKPAPTRPKPDPAPRPQPQAAPSEAAVQAQNQQAQQSTRTAAAQSVQGTGRSMSPAKWQSRLMAHLERHKPRSKGERGLAYVTFRIDDAGNVLSVQLARSSGVASVDDAAVGLVRRASPVPAPPPDVQHTITVPVKFSRR